MNSLHLTSRVTLVTVLLSISRPTAAEPVVIKTFDISGSGSCARMRMGDLNGDGRLDFLMVQPTQDTPSFVQMLTAYDGHTGERLWQVGRDNGLTGTDRDEPAQIYDIDNDGKAEVVAAMGGELRYYDGATGTLKKSFTLPNTNAHDAIVFANFSRKPTPQDIVLKDRYSRAWVIDNDGKLLWTYSGITGHYPWPYDSDGDGRDELFIGYSRLNSDGTPVYPAAFNSDHPDCIWLGDIDNNPANGVEIVYGLAQQPSMQAVNVRTGKVVWTNSDSKESQQVIFGDFRKDLPGLEVYGLDRVNRTNQDALFVVSSSGTTLWKEIPDNSGFGTAIRLVRNWDGSNTAMCLAIKRGGNVKPELRNGMGGIVARIGEDGQNAAVADFAGDEKQEIVMYDTRTAAVYAAEKIDYALPPPTPGKPLPQVKEYYNYSRYGSGDVTAATTMHSNTGGAANVGGSANIGGASVLAGTSSVSGVPSVGGAATGGSTFATAGATTAPPRAGAGSGTTIAIGGMGGVTQPVSTTSGITGGSTAATTTSGVATRGSSGGTPNSLATSNVGGAANTSSVTIDGRSDVPSDGCSCRLAEYSSNQPLPKTSLLCLLGALLLLRRHHSRPIFGPTEA